MSDRLFYVGAQDDKSNVTGYVASKFLTLNGEPVVDPTPGGSQKAYIYADPSDRFKTSGEIANPKNYLIVPANYSEQQAKAFAAEIADTLNRFYPEDEKGNMGGNLAREQMISAFRQNGSQDLQRNPQWGIPKDSVVPAFVSSASYHLGSVTRHAGMSKLLAEVGGGTTNRINADVVQPVKRLLGRKWTSIDTNGDIWGLSKQNYANLSKGYTDAGARNDKPPTADYFGYRPQGQYPAGQIGDSNGLGVGDWRFPLAGADPADPTRPVPPPQTDSTPAPRLVRVNGSKSPAAPIAPSGHRPSFSDRFGNWTASPEDGFVPRDPNLPVPSPEPGRPVGIFSGKPMPWWTVPPPLGGLLVDSNASARGSRSSPVGSAGDALSSPPPAPRRSEGAALPYVLEYLQYLKQLDGG